MQISGWEFLAVCHHSDKFGGPGHCEKGNMFLICHTTSPDHMFQGLYVTLWAEAFHGKLSTCQVGGYSSCASGDI